METFCSLLLDYIEYEKWVDNGGSFKLPPNTITFHIPNINIGINSKTLFYDYYDKILEQNTDISNKIKQNKDVIENCLFFCIEVINLIPLNENSFVSSVILLEYGAYKEILANNLKNKLLFCEIRPN